MPYCSRVSFLLGMAFLSRFPGFSVPGGITYRFCRETPLNRKFGKIKCWSGVSGQPKTII